MSSDSDEENFCFYGKPLEPYDEDAFPKKRPITVEEQVATDAQGRRRFHGAFTGGFSAGFFNTVGSLEGWTPSEFKSTRQDKAKSVQQRPEDFMDDEDIGEYGIAPQTVKATSDYSTAKKRHRKAFADGPIPGEPVLHSLLTKGNETIGYLLLKNIGIQDKIVRKDEETGASNSRVYGCHIPKTVEMPTISKHRQYKIPDIYKEFLEKPKANTFGLGYEGLDRSHINLFQPSANLVVRGKNNEKMTISGKAFGVGAFEDDDEDIYVKEDMTKYDFELTSEKKKTEKQNSSNLLFDLFLKSKSQLAMKKTFPPPTIPHSFSGKHKIKKSRFEPVEEEKEVARKEMNPSIRAKYLGESSDKNYTESKPIREKPVKPEVKEEVKEDPPNKGFDLAASLMSDRFVSASKEDDANNILAPVEPSETTHGTEDMRNAVKMKMFGPLTRIRDDWYPKPVLCKRFNVPEPLLDKSELQKNRKRTKNLIFEYQKFAEVENIPVSGLSHKLENEENPVPTQSTSEDNQNASMEITPEPSSSTQPDNTTTITNSDPPKDITDKIDIEKNVDLFKAVFLSSSESESENEEEREEDKKKDDEMKSKVLSDEFLPKIRPLKQGILSNVPKFTFKKPEKSDSVQNEVVEIPEEKQPDPDWYGPKLPEGRPASKPETTTIDVSSDEDDWVEKDSKDKKKKSKSKKEKKHKKDKQKKKHKKDKR